MISRVKLVAAVFISALFLYSCSEPGGPPPDGPDTLPPTVSILFPDSSEYDENGDAFVDVVVHWSDEVAVDPATANVTVTDQSGATFALTNWDVVERNSQRMRLREQLAHLLPPGTHRLEVSVEDTHGNIGRDTVTITLPPAQFWKTISTNRPMDGWPVEIAFCSNDRAYIASGTSIIVVDAIRAELISVVPDPYAVENLQTPLCVPGDTLVHVTPRGEQLRMRDHTWTLWPRPDNLYSGIAQSRVNSDLLYAGEYLTADLAVLSRSTNTRLRRVGLPFSQEPEDRAFSVAVMPGDAKVYSTRAMEGGILVSDPETGSILTRIAPDGEDVTAVANRIKLSRDDRFLYAAVQEAKIRGFAEIDTGTDEVSRYMPLNIATDVPVCLALSPSGQRAFVVTSDRVPDIPSTNYLIDIPRWQIIGTFRRDRQPGQVRIDGCPGFRPDGRLLFLPRNMDMDVYLNRE